MEHPPGGIVVPTAGMLRHTQFVSDLISTLRVAPAGTQVAFPTSGFVVQNLNRGLIQFMQVEELQWFWLQADDHTFHPLLLEHLLDRQLDIVCPLVVRRASPYELVFGDETTDVDEDSGREYPAYKSSSVDDMPSKTDPFPVEIAGSAGMLIRRHVLEKIGYPYFETTDGIKLNEDIVFSKKARACGFQVHIDPQALMGHLITMPVWPI